MKRLKRLRLNNERKDILRDICGDVYRFRCLRVNAIRTQERPLLWRHKGGVLSLKAFCLHRRTAKGYATCGIGSVVCWSTDPLGASSPVSSWKVMSFSSSTSSCPSASSRDDALPSRMKCGPRVLSLSSRGTGMSRTTLGLLSRGLSYFSLHL